MFLKHQTLEITMGVRFKTLIFHMWKLRYLVVRNLPWFLSMN